MSKKLKFSALVLIGIVLSINQVWGTQEFSDSFSDVGTGSSTTISSRTGWSSFTKVYAQYNTGIRVGTGSASGSITKTAMSGISGTVTLTVSFYAAKYNTDAVGLNVSVGGAGTASETSFTLAGNAGVTSTTSAATWTSDYLCSFTITNATSATTITFSTSTKKRIILGPITITSAAAGCGVPISPTNGTVSASGQPVSWTAPSSAPANGYLVAYSGSATAPGDNIKVSSAQTWGDFYVIPVTSGTTFTFNESSYNYAGTQYYWWVRSKCSSSDYSDWVAGTAFTIPSSCNKSVTINQGAATNCSLL